MDGIDRYFEPNTLDGLSIYETPEALLVDGSNAMQADANMGGHYVKNVADATDPDQAVNLGQFITELDLKADLTYVNDELALKADLTYVNDQLALKADLSYVNAQLATKADDSTVVHKTGDESIGGIKTFTTLPVTSLLATTNSQMTNFDLVKRQIPFHDMGYVNYAVPIGGFGIYYSLLLAATVPHSNNPLQIATVPRQTLYGSTILLTARTTYNYAIIRARQSYTFPPAAWIGAYVTIGIYNRNNQLVAKTNQVRCVDTSVLSITERNYGIAFQSSLTVPETDIYVMVLHFTIDGTSNWDFMFSQSAQSDVMSAELQSIGAVPEKYCQKAWYSFIGVPTWDPPPSLSYSITTSNRSIWIGLTNLNFIPT